MLSPSSRSLAPATVLDSDAPRRCDRRCARGGAAGRRPRRPAHEHRRARRLAAADARLRPGGRGQGPGARQRRLRARHPSCTRASASRAARWRSAAATTARRRSRPGCDTANIWIGFPGTAYTEDRDSHTLTLPASFPGTAGDAQRRGGFRYLTLFLDGPGSIDVDAVSLDFTPAAGQGDDPSRYAGWFLSSDDTLNKAWYAGAYTVQLNTDASDTAKSWPYDAGERDHADDQVPHAATRRRDLRRRQARPDRVAGRSRRPAAGGAADHRRPRRGRQLAVLAGRAAGARRLRARPNRWWVSTTSTRSAPTASTSRGSCTTRPSTGASPATAPTWSATGPGSSGRWRGSRRSATTPGLIAFAASGSCGHYGYSDCGHETYVNALYKRNLDELATLAAALGKDGSAYASRSQRRRGARSTARLWDEAAGAYRLSLELPDAHPQDANAAAVLTGVAGTRATRALAFLRAHTWSRFGSLTIASEEANASLSPFYAPLPSGFEAQARFSGTGDARGVETLAGLDLVRRFWGYQLSQDPHSTLWEHARTDGTPNLGAFSSLAHGWAAGPTESLTTDVLGVDPTSAGLRALRRRATPGRPALGAGRGPDAARDDRGRVDALGRPAVRAGGARAEGTPSAGGRADVRPRRPRPGRRPHRPEDDRHARPGSPHRDQPRRGPRRPRRRWRAVLTPSHGERGPPGDTVAFRLGVSGAGDLRGTVTVTGPDGWNVSPEEAALDLATDGTPASEELRVYAEVPDDAAGGSYPVKIDVRTRDGARASATATVRLTVERRLFSFEDSRRGLGAGRERERRGARQQLRQRARQAVRGAQARSRRPSRRRTRPR